MLFCILKSRDITLPTNGFSSSHVWMWELDHKESWAPKNWCFWTVVLEKTLESPLDFKEIKLVNSECSLEGLMLKLKLQYLGHLMWRASWLIGKDPDAGKDWRQEEKGGTENKMVGWHHWHEFEQALGVGEGQGGLACCSPWGRKELDTTERPNWTELNFSLGPPLVVFLQCTHVCIPGASLSKFSLLWSHWIRDPANRLILA